MGFADRRRSIKMKRRRAQKQKKARLARRRAGNTATETKPAAKAKKKDA